MLQPEAEDSEAPTADSNTAIEVVAQVLEELSGHSAGWWEFRGVLGVIGRAIEVDRVYVFENGFDRQTGMLLATQRAEWCADGVRPEPNNPELRGIAYESLGDRWLEELSSGRPLQLRATDFTDVERAILGPQGVKSMLLVPLMVGGVWWGLIGFDQCSHEREWDPDAVQLLDIAGSLIAGQIDRQRLRRGLETAERRSRFAMQLSGVGVWDCDPETREMFIAAEFKDALGFADEEIPNTMDAWLSRVHPDDVARLKLEIDRLISGGASSFELEHRVITKRSETRWLLSRGSAIHDANGKTVRVIGTSTDITERKQSESAFRAIFEGSPDGMMLVDVAGAPGPWTIADCNDRAATMHGYERKDVLGRELELFLVNPPGETSRSAIAAKIRESGVVWGEAIHVRKDGSKFWCGFRQTILDIGGREKLLLVAQDITERRRRDDERLRASKLEALGQLAGGIAHDFNNVLTVITGNLSLLRMDLPPDTPVKDLIDTMDQAGSRARELAAQLLTFARGGVPVMRVVSLTEVVNTAAHVASRGSRCKIRVEITPDAPPVEADEGQIGQVLQNLLLNAEQAMEEGGEIVVAMDLHEERNLFDPGRSQSLRIRVTDTGHGIPEEIRERIFDPYFSTWSHHSGLGLATAYSIVRQHHGSITVKSQPGRGTEFTILLPAVVPASVPDRSSAPTRPGEARGCRILVMDDEEVIRSLAKRGLSRFGYEVVPAKDGEEAISIFEEAMRLHTPFAAVVLDMVIPGGLGGEKTIERLREIDPDVRGLAMSGYSKSGVIGNPTAFGFKGGLPKPFSLEQFAAAIAAVIAS